MKQTEKNYILQFINLHKTPVFEGVIEDHIRAAHNYKASNVARVCRQLRSDGYIQKIGAPHPETGREVNTYVITESGRKFLYDQMTPVARSFMEEFGPQKKLEVKEVGVLF